jgi:hypothetical protein
MTTRKLFLFWMLMFFTTYSFGYGEYLDDIHPPIDDIEDNYSSIGEFLNSLFAYAIGVCAWLYFSFHTYAWLERRFSKNALPVEDVFCDEKGKFDFTLFLGGAFYRSFIGIFMCITPYLQENLMPMMFVFGVALAFFESH